VLGRDDACRSETVAGAAAKGAALPKRPAEPTPAAAETDADLARALSFFLPGEDTLRDATGENTWRNNRYEAPGVVVYGSPVDGAYLFIAARNAGSRAIVNLEARFALALPNGARLDLECGPRNPYPFSTRRLTAGAAAPIACRQPDGVPVADLVAAMRAANAAAPAVRIVGFELRDPAAAVVARGDAAAPRFAIGPSETLGREGRDFDPAAPPKSLPAELADMDCATLATCPTPYQALAMAVERPFDLHPLLLAPTIGVLLGLVVGGFARRAFTWGGVLAALLVLIAAVGIAMLFQSVSSGGGENGFALMAIAALMAGALLGFGAGLPAFFVTIALLALLRRRLEPAAGRAPP
jgi:hypothetical protein